MAAITAANLATLLKSCFLIDIPPTHGRLVQKVLNGIDDSIKVDLEAAPTVIRNWVSVPLCNDQTQAAAFGKYLSACLGALTALSTHRALGVAKVAKSGALMLAFTGMTMVNMEAELRDRGANVDALSAIFDEVVSVAVSDGGRALLLRWAKGINDSNNLPANSKVAKFIGALGANAGGDAARRTRKLCKILAAIEAARAEAIMPGNAFTGCTPGVNPLHAIVDDTTVAAVSELWKVAKPGSVFGGFARWGKANYGSVAESERGHFRKHVLRAPIHGDADKDESEHQKWWTLLGIRLTLDAVTQALASGGTTRTLSAPERSWFDAAKVLKPANVIDFVKSDILQKAPALIDELAASHMAAFTKAGRDAAASAPLVFAFTSREFAMVACFTTTMFVVGRMDDGVLAMSSCYIPNDLQDKKDSSSKNLLWLLRSA
jgi:hypothetical protein